MDFGDPGLLGWTMIVLCVIKPRGGTVGGNRFVNEEVEAIETMLSISHHQHSDIESLLGSNVSTASGHVADVDRPNRPFGRPVEIER
jgi:hypothetical protein